MGAPQRRGRDFRKPDRLYLASFDKTGERFAHLFDLNPRVAPMHVVKIYCLDVEPSQTFVQRLRHMLFGIVKAMFWIARDAHFGRDCERAGAAACLKPLTNHVFRPPHTVDICCINMCDAHLQTGI